VPQPTAKLAWPARARLKLVTARQRWRSVRWWEARRGVARSAQRAWGQYRGGAGHEEEGGDSPQQQGDMEVMRAGGTAVPLKSGGFPVEEVRQGHRLRHRRGTGRASGKVRGGGAHGVAAHQVGGGDGSA
jgi:hypothetical protein